MRLDDKTIRDTAYDIAIEIVYGGDRFDVQDIEIFLDGIDAPSLDSMRKYTEQFARQIQPGIREAYLKEELNMWLGSRIRRDEDVVAARRMDDKSVDELSSVIQRQYKEGFSSESFEVSNRLCDMLYRVSQQDIDKAVDKAHMSLVKDLGDAFSESSFRSELDFLLGSVRTAEFHRVIVAYQAEDPDSPSLYRSDYDWPKKISDYISSKGYRVGEGLDAALRVLSERAHVDSENHACPLLDSGLKAMLLSHLATEIDYKAGQEDTFLAAPFMAMDGKIYDKVRSEGIGRVILTSEDGYVREPESVAEAIVVCRNVFGNILGREATERMNRGAACAFSLVELLNAEGRHISDGATVLDLPGLSFQNTELTQISSHEGHDGEIHYNFMYRDGAGEEHVTIGFNMDMLAMHFRGMSDDDIIGMDEYVSDYRAVSSQKDVSRAKTFNLDSPLMVSVEMGGRVETVKAERFAIDLLGGIVLDGRRRDGSEVTVPMTMLSEDSVWTFANKLGHMMKPEKKTEVSQHF